MAEGISIKKNIAWNTAGNFVYLFLQWLLTYLVVRFLGYEEAGYFSLAMAVAGTLVGFSLYGMRNYQVSDLDHEFSDAMYIHSRYITSGISLIVCLAIILVGQYSPYVALCILFYMGFKISEALSDVYQGIQQRSMRMDYIGKAFLIKGVLSLVVFAAFLVTTRSLPIAILAMAISTFAVIVFYEKRCAGQFISEQHSPSSSIRKLLMVCLPLALFTFLFNALGQLPRYFLGMQLGAEELGFYTSIAMPAIIIQVSASYLFSPLVTPFANLLYKGDIRGFAKMAAKVLAIMAILFIVFFAAFALLGDWLLLLLFGEGIEGHVYLLMPLVACAMLTAVAWFLTSLLVVLRKQRMLLCVAALSFLVMIISVFPLLGVFGSNGASYSLILALVFCSLLCLGIITVFVKNSDSPQKENG